MRMQHYFLGAVAVTAPALLLTAGLGIFGHPELHLKVGLVTAMAAVGTHTLAILFMIVTGRVLKAAMAARSLPPEFLTELNEYFRSKAAYPAALLAATATVAAAVLGYGAPALGLSPAVHMLAGVLALVVNLWAFPLELRALRENQTLIDRAAGTLDAIDRDLARRGTLPQPEPIDARTIARGALIVAVSAWMPYLYWALVVWRGDFGKASVHPWLEVSVLALLVWWIARREARAEARSEG